MGSFTAEKLESVRRAREELLTQGIIPAGIVTDTIIHSWQRSAERGIGIERVGCTGSHRVDLAVICATNRRVRDSVAAGSFREDLYYRLNGLLLTLPSLREREDRLLLANKILESLCGDSRYINIHPQVLSIFEQHPWPGNIRQMHNVLRTAVALLGDRNEITDDDLSGDFLEQAGAMSGLKQPHRTDGEENAGNALQAEMEARLISSTLDLTGGNIAEAARKMGIGRNTLYRKLRSLAEADGNAQLLNR